MFFYNCFISEKQLKIVFIDILSTVELQYLEHLWDHENMFDIGVVRANEC